MGKSYRPSNGSEGDMFMAHFCERCTKESWSEDPKALHCDIIMNTMGYDIEDPKYPREWIVDDDGLSNPRCTAFEKKDG